MGRRLGAVVWDGGSDESLAIWSTAPASRSRTLRISFSAFAPLPTTAAVKIHADKTLISPILVPISFRSVA